MRSAVQGLDGFLELLGPGFGVAENHLHGFVAEEFLDAVQGHAFVPQAGGKGVAEHVDVDMAQASAHPGTRYQSVWRM